MVDPPCAITSCAPVTCTTGSTTLHWVLPPPPQPAACAVGVGPAVAVAVIVVIVPRPLWSALPRPAVVEPGCAGTGFWPGTFVWPEGFEHVYVSDPKTVTGASAGPPPRPLKWPPLRVAAAAWGSQKVIVGSAFTLTAASAPPVRAAATSTAMRIEIRRMSDPFAISAMSQVSLL